MKTDKKNAPVKDNYFKTFGEYSMPAKNKDGTYKKYGPCFTRLPNGQLMLSSQIGYDYTLTTFFMGLEYRLKEQKILKPWENFGLVEKIL